MTVTDDPRSGFNDNTTILGRGEINDIDAILAIPTHDPAEVEHVVTNDADTIFTWDYSLSRPPLRKLYEKAKTGQWNGTTDLPWHIDVDVEKTVAEDHAEREFRLLRLLAATISSRRYPSVAQKLSFASNTTPSIEN